LTDYWLMALLAGAVVTFAVGVAAYWLGHRHGSSNRVEPRVDPRAAPAALFAHIPAYRINELAVLMELGVLTPEEFEQEKGKLHASRPAVS
jgi:hypothetical protein